MKLCMVLRILCYQIRALGYKGDYYIYDLTEVRRFQNKYLGRGF